MQEANTVEDHTRNIIFNQTVLQNDPETLFLDQVVSKVIAKSIYDKSEKLKYIGTTDIIFPSQYTAIRMQQGANVSVPSTHQTEVIIQGKIDSSIEVVFHYLQPKIRRLSEMGNGRFVNIPSKVLEIDGEKYKAGNEDPVVKSFSTKKIPISDIVEKPFETTLNERKTEQKSDIKDNTGAIRGRFTFVTDDLYLQFTVKCVQLQNPTEFKVTIKVTNLTNIERGTGRQSYNLDEVMQKSIFGAYTILKCHDCFVLSDKDEISRCTNLNTSPNTSPNANNLVESSPIIIHDEPWTIPVKMTVKLVDLVNNEDLFLGNMSIIEKSNREKLSQSGKIKDLQNIFKALYNSSPSKFEYLYQFQWDGIMTFLNTILEGEHGTMVLRAPTGSGKSVVFYVCSVIEKIFSKVCEGTTTFITFPTRALNSQQFSEMISFFYNLNNQGIRATLGLFMGKDTDSAVRSISLTDFKKGEEIPIIERCPACKMDRIVADIREGKARILPQCETCGLLLDFLYLSNYETNSFCPTVVVGTPDKLVNALTHDEKSHILFGAPAKKCQNCGFHYPLCQKDQKYDTHVCKQCTTDMGADTITQSSPRLIVFDEIHTLVGTQGNLLGHFLSLLKVTASVYGVKGDYRYLGATATISNQEELIENITGYDKNLQINFPPEEQFFKKENQKGYFMIHRNRIRHRFVVLEPLGVTTRASVRSVVHSLYSHLSAIREVISENKDHQDNFLNYYGNQTVYVLRKDDGRDLEKDIPDYIVQTGLTRPRIRFGSGDLSNSQLSSLNKLVRANKLDILVVTQIYGQGVDFPGLNIIHFFGVPRSFIEFSQVVGRTGRGNVPGLVFIHITPQVPRDQWVYRNFRHMIENMVSLYEPTPINVANKYAISLSLPNVFNTLVLARSYLNHQFRYADHVHQSLVENKGLLKKIIEEVIETYDRPSMSEEEREELKTKVFDSVKNILIDFKGSNLRTSDHLSTKKLLVPTLRPQKKSIKYTEQVKYPILDQLIVSKELEEE